MKYTIDQLYQRLYQNTYNVYDVFKNFFGEEYVDLQHQSHIDIQKNLIKQYIEHRNITPIDDIYDIPENILKDFISSNKENLLKLNIIVWFPHVTVTNENGYSVDIQDLYAKIEITHNGKIPWENVGFLLNRATYSSEQFNSNYMHSHIREIPKNDFTKFMSPCLGSGPIKATITSLKSEYDEAFWLLFCQELALYVTVESLRGGPWKRLENITNNTSERRYKNTFNFKDNAYKQYLTQISETDFKDFIKYYLLNGNLNICYTNQEYKCGLSFYDFLIDITNSFIDYYNKNLKTTKEAVTQLYQSEFLENVIIKDRIFYISVNNNTAINYSIYRDQHVLYFKDRDIKLSIIENIDNETVLTTVMNWKVAMYILKSILTILNFRYKNEHNAFINKRQSATTCQKAFYV